MKIVYDIDDTLWGLNKKICEKLNIDENKITKFEIHGIDELTKAEQDSIIYEYTNSDNFRNICWYKGIYDILAPEKLGAQIYIKSNSTSKEIAELKYIQIKQLINIDDSRLQLHIITVGECKKKELDSDMEIFIDDSPYNIANSTAKVNIILNHPWNTSMDALEIMAGKNVIRFDTLEEINDFVYNYVKEKCG